jgi:FMN reductase
VSTIAVVGNPKPRSRTRAAAELVVEQLTGAPPDDVIDVIDLGPGLLGWGDAGVEQAVATLRAAELAVVASPTFKATYTGLLKLFLDHVDTGDLAGVTAVPLMLGAGPTHALAPELLLKPVLVELGATAPTRGLYLLDAPGTPPARSTGGWPPRPARWRRPGRDCETNLHQTDELDRHISTLVPCGRGCRERAVPPVRRGPGADRQRALSGALTHALAAHRPSALSRPDRVVERASLRDPS